MVGPQTSPDTGHQTASENPLDLAKRQVAVRMRGLADMLKAFDTDGFAIVPSLFEGEEPYQWQLDEDTTVYRYEEPLDSQYRRNPPETAHVSLSTQISPQTGDLGSGEITFSNLLEHQWLPEEGGWPDGAPYRPTYYLNIEHNCKFVRLFI